MKYSLFLIFFLSSSHLFADQDSFVAYPGFSDQDTVLYKVDESGDVNDKIVLENSDLEVNSCYIKTFKGFKKLETLECFRYYISKEDSSNQELISVIGNPSYTFEGVNDFFRGYKISDVDGIEYCGERDDCENVFIFLFTSEQVIKSWISAINTNTPCRIEVKGYWIWNLESIDLIADEVICLK